MNKDAEFVFQGVKSFLGACRALSDVLAAKWVQPDISFFGEMFLNAAPSHSYFSITHAKPLDSNINVEIAIPSLFNTKKKKRRVKMVLKHSWAAPIPLGTPSSNSITKLY